ncbi:MAG: hypothetical protein WAR37_00795 [Candidatus Microsaccharimonas sp.]
MKRTKKSTSTITFLAIIALAGLSTTGIIVLTGRNESENSPQDSTSQSQNSSATVNYKNGSYSAVGTYPTQGGRESIDVTITISNEIIQDTSIVQNAITPQAKEYQGRFASAYKESVIGKRIDEVSLSRVAGSSLTSIGFNKALTQIKSDAIK